MILQVAVDQVDPNPYQPRAEMDEESLRDLATSIAAHGVMQPILVRPLATGRYQLIAGERRWRAARLAGLASVPCIARDADDNELLAMALVENIQRENLNPVESARGYRRLIDEFGLTQEQVADLVGKSRVAVANTLRLLQLPQPILLMIEEGRLTEGHGRCLLGVCDDTDALSRLAAEAVEGGHSVRELERRVRTYTDGAPRRAKRAPRTPALPVNDPEMETLREDLQTTLGTAVRLRGRGPGGVIEIEYYDSEDLARIIDLVIHT